MLQQQTGFGSDMTMFVTRICINSTATATTMTYTLIPLLVTFLTAFMRNQGCSKGCKKPRFLGFLQKKT